jgi:cation diffusion facilitator CzcD-associated flavoprotein CzcO
MTTSTFDVLIVGAGLAGIGAAADLRRRFPQKKVGIIEARERMGGTWDLFRYPGIRSDSDMYTLGYRSRPWRERRSIVDGPSIRRYIEETAAETGVDELIRFGQRLVSANWSSERACWTLDIAHQDGSRSTLEARFLHFCSGYYSYTEAYRPHWDGEADFRGEIVHPQFWPEGYDYRGKKVVVIGSGATAITLVPSMAEQAGHVTLLQRSPSYVASQPADDPLAKWLTPWLPKRLAYAFVRWKCILAGLFFFWLARSRPKPFKRSVINMARKELPPGFDVATHFTPHYKPWDQRLCAVPDGDLFKAISAGKVSMVTDTIERFVPEGIKLTSGRVLEADLIVTATGLKIEALGGAQLSVDGQPVKLDEIMVYRGALFSGVPNLIYTFGYTNASWTLRADLISHYLGRLLRHMDKHGYDSVVAVRDPAVGEQPFLDFTSGYVQRALPALPKQGDRFPWRIHQNYLRDLHVTRFSPLIDRNLHFTRTAG